VPTVLSLLLLGTVFMSGVISCTIQSKRVSNNKDDVVVVVVRIVESGAILVNRNKIERCISESDIKIDNAPIAPDKHTGLVTTTTTAAVVVVVVESVVVVVVVVVIKLSNMVRNNFGTADASAANVVVVVVAAASLSPMLLLLLDVGGGAKAYMNQSFFMVVGMVCRTTYKADCEIR
jgi:hypothetical protein